MIIYSLRLKFGKWQSQELKLTLFNPRTQILIPMMLLNYIKIYDHQTILTKFVLGSFQANIQSLSQCIQANIQGFSSYRNISKHFSLLTPEHGLSTYQCAFVFISCFPYLRLFYMPHTLDFYLFLTFNLISIPIEKLPLTS